MADSFIDLGNVLLSKREQIPLKEANVLKACNARAKRHISFGFFGGVCATWQALRRLHNPFYRFSLSLGAGSACGIWLGVRSLKSSVDHILSLKGSRIQTELANVILKKYHNDPWAMRALSKHFYYDEVYNDSSGDRPVLKWRHRNISGEVTRAQATSYGEENDPKENNVKKTTAMERKQVYASAIANARAADDSTENPFDLILGRSESKDEAPLPDTPTASSKRQTRKEKRSRRRHRRQHLEESESDE